MISLSEHIEQTTALELVVLGQRNWIERARSGKIKRAPEIIERRANHLETREALLERLQSEDSHG